jgi:IS30 family transposase
MRQEHKRTFRHMNQGDRDRMEALLKKNHLQKEVAIILGFDPSVISRERKRQRSNGIYQATTAEHKARVKRSNSKYQGMKIEKNGSLKTYIVRELKKARSPDEIAGYMKRVRMVPRVGTNAIYKWLYSPFGQPYCRYLCTYRYRKKKQIRKTKREMIPDRIPLRERPIAGEHAEGDLFVSPVRLHSVRSGALLCVQSSKLLIGTLIENRKPSTMVQAVNRMLAHCSITDTTWDNGIENKYHQGFTLPAYFCDPHSPWQKPHVENSILLLRRWFVPKGTNLDDVSEEDFQKYLNILDHKYRKSLNYHSAYEVSVERGIIQKIPPREEDVMRKIAIH